MPVEKTDTLVVGAGQAGIAASEHLSACGIPHLVLERHRIAERWRTERWDSLVANGPAWHDRFPGMTFAEDGDDDFVPKDRVADYFAAYADKIEAPVRTGVEVTQVTPLTGRHGFRVETSDGVIEASNVIAATGPFQSPVIPPIVPETAGVTQIHSSAYRNPSQLSEGAVLVVGAGSSGVQIADELLEAGRKVYLSVGPHDRPPRSYRGRDFVWWLGVLNKWDMEATPGAEHTTIAVSGARGGETIDFRKLAHNGMKLVGLTESYADGKIRFAADLADNVRNGDAYLMNLLDEADAFVLRNGLDLPEEPDARRQLADPACMTDPMLSLDLAEAGITTIIWATGFSADYSWLPANALTPEGKPAHQRGVSKEAGIYFLGLPWQTRRGSSFIWGVWFDARYVADHISKQRGYMAYQATAAQETIDA
ncbi:flavin-containing monooxygenase [Pseudooceanicola nitratireducens]|uniref:flavin-containing monooxygenase n=1 Tax=Pseudooceanicola nitratireducens TaxID=517719 RepID=UPI001C938BBA|nr:NAD(P)/FAD-dependent oxidoreductase [Pseudooceanicola nitratireducens]MBY6159071.1 NAD(P)/FAD-dependent oxidoreductase [Pseudooceanicola nitratireducens]